MFCTDYKISFSSSFLPCSRPTFLGRGCRLSAGSGGALLPRASPQETTGRVWLRARAATVRSCTTLHSGSHRSIIDPPGSGWIVLESLVILLTFISFAITGMLRGVWRYHMKIGLDIHRRFSCLSLGLVRRESGIIEVISHAFP